MALCLRTDHNRAHLREMRTVEMQSAAAEENAALRFGDREVANVLAYFRKSATQQRPVVRQAVDQFVDVRGILETRLTHQHERSPCPGHTVAPAPECGLQWIRQPGGHVPARCRQSRCGNRAWPAA